MMKKSPSGKPFGKGFKYTSELVLILHIYSEKAYEIVRKTFDISLPHQSVIRTQHSIFPAELEFTQLTFVELKKKAE